MTDRLAIQVVDLAFGDCGKGSVVDFLTRRCSAELVVRFNGGPQAGHNVVTPDGARSHTFSQFGAGSFVAGVGTVLSRFMLIEPYALFNEAAHLQRLGVPDVWGRLLIDGRCPVITPAQQAANRIRELARAAAAHGTCGVGVGETVQDLLDHPRLALHARELRDRTVVARKLRSLCHLKKGQLKDAVAALNDHPAARFAIDTLTDRSWLDAAVDNYAELAGRAQIASEQAIGSALRRGSGTIIFEGAQGILLDEQFGFHPHTTWSTTTFANADRVLDESRYEGRRYRLGVLRSYFTRHGPGPFVAEDAALSSHLPEPHNNSAGWQGRFRVGLFDAVAARYALAVAGRVDGLAITHLDRLPEVAYRMCKAYQDDGPAGREDPFVREGGRIVDIRVHHPVDLPRQECLTRALGRCRPIDTGSEGDNPRSFMEGMERQLRAPVVLTSAGQTAGEKCFIAPFG